MTLVDNSFAAGRGAGWEARLQLRLVSSHGYARNAVLRLPADGAGMADALELGGERLNDRQWRAANLCRIVRHGDSGGWQLSNGSHTLVCALNSERVVLDDVRSIVAGDVLELGFLRFVIEAAEDAAGAGSLAPAHSYTHVHIPDQMQPQQPSNDRGEDPFDLCDLASPTTLATQFTEARDDPFAVLDIDGVEASSPTQIRFELFNEKPARTPAVATGVSARMPALIVRGDLTPTAPDPKPADVVLFDILRDEFERVVRDPTQLAGRTDWEGLLAAEAEQAPTLEDLSRQAQTYPLLRDILRVRAGIDQVIEGFDPLGKSDLLDIDEPDDVLRLFAPEVARSAKVVVPSLTRREHHDLSPDSHVRMGGTYSKEDTQR